VFGRFIHSESVIVKSVSVWSDFSAKGSNSVILSCNYDL
jgi:hypothetical protein